MQNAIELDAPTLWGKHRKGKWVKKLLAEFECRAYMFSLDHNQDKNCYYAFVVRGKKVSLKVYSNSDNLNSFRQQVRYRADGLYSTLAAERKANADKA